MSPLLSRTASNNPTRLPSGKLAFWIGGALALLIAFLLRVWNLGSAPPGFHFDEAAYGLIANSIRHGDFRIFYSEFTGREPIFMYMVALSQLVFGQTIFAERLPAAIIGVAIIAATYFVTREVFLYRGTLRTTTGESSPGERRWVDILAALAALAVAVSFWSLILNREGWRANLTPLAAALAYGATWRAARLRTRAWAIAAGALTGLSLYTYLAARFVPVVFVAFALYFAVLWLLIWRRKADMPQPDRSLFKLGLMWAAAAIMVAAPLAVYFILHRADFLERAAQIDVLTGPNALSSLWNNVVQAAGMLSIEGSQDLRYNLPGRPVFDLVASLFFYVGLVICVVRAWRRPEYGFLLCWLVVMLLPTILSEEGNHPLRAYGAMPAMMAIWALGVVEAWRLLPRVIPKQGFALGGALAVLLLAISFYFSMSDYTGKWLPDPRLPDAFDVGYTDLAAYLNTLPEDGTPRVLATEKLCYPCPAVLYLAPKTQNYRWVENTQSVIIPKESGAGGKVQYIVPDVVALREELSPDWYKPLGQPLNVQQFNNASGQSVGKLYTFDLPTGLTPDQLAEPMKEKACGGAGVNYNDDATLLGWSINSEAVTGHALLLNLYWQAKRPTQEAWQVFVHMVDRPDSLKRWGQEDANGAFSQAWKPGDLFVGEYNFQIDQAAPPGTYMLQVGMYDLNNRRYPRAHIAPESAACPGVNADHTAYSIPGIKVRR